jgi:hypothetical protein
VTVLRATTVVLFLLCACGGAKKAPTDQASNAGAGDAAAAPSASSAATDDVSAPASASTSPPTSNSTSTSNGPTPTGGTVLVGDIVAPKGFDPKPTIDGMKGPMLGCYNKARAAHPDLAGKLSIRITIGEGGAVQSVDANPGGHANSPDLVACRGDALRSAKFPKPGGTAIVTAPLVFHP